MREEERLASGELIRNFTRVNRGHVGVGEREENHLTAAGSLGGADNFETVLARDPARFAFWAQADNDSHPAVLQIERMGSTLRAEADDGAGFAPQMLQVSISIEINSRRHTAAPEASA